MKLCDFTEGMRCNIIAAAKRSLIMLGITADVHLSVEMGQDTYTWVAFLKTSNFNTTPVIYKNVCVEGKAILKEIGIEGVYDLIFHLDYRFECFHGGHNGVYLGELSFRVFENREAVDFIGFTIQ